MRPRPAPAGALEDRSIPLSFALTGPVAGWVGIDMTLIGAGIASALVTAAFLFVPGMRDTERDGSLRRAAMAEESP